jgi:hypothetical protein
MMPDRKQVPMHDFEFHCVVRSHSVVSSVCQEGLIYESEQVVAISLTDCYRGSQAHASE